MQNSSRVPPQRAIGVQELHGMARILVSRHGAAAVDMAGFLAAEHKIYGDEKRMATWLAVQGVADDMVKGRIGNEPLKIQ